MHIEEINLLMQLEACGCTAIGTVTEKYLKSSPFNKKCPGNSKNRFTLDGPTVNNRVPNLVPRACDPFGLRQGTRDSGVMAFFEPTDWLTKQ